MTIEAVISLISRQSIPRKRIQATIGAVIENVTTASDSTGS